MEGILGMVITVAMECDLISKTKSNGKRSSC